MKTSYRSVRRLVTLCLITVFSFQRIRGLDGSFSLNLGHDGNVAKTTTSSSSLHSLSSPSLEGNTSSYGNLSVGAVSTVAMAQVESKAFQVCSEATHSYMIYSNGTVQWRSEHVAKVFQHRGKSMHCLLARVAPRLNRSVQIRIHLGDAQVTEKMLFNDEYALLPALPSCVNNSNTSAPTNPKSSRLFPDFSFESWPEVNDFNIHDVMEQVVRSAHDNGAPSDWQAWAQRRDSRLAWRGNIFPARKAVITYLGMFPNHTDVGKITYRRRKKRVKLRREGSLSRTEHCRYRYLLHVNGDLDAYSSSLKWKLLCGALVFVPVQPNLFMEWWNRNMTPHHDFVPYSSPQDLMQQLNYYSEHLEEAARIASNGFEMAKAAFVKRNEHMVAALLHYAERADGPRDCCSVKNCTRLAEKKAMSLEELQAEYGPQVCGSRSDV